MDICVGLADADSGRGSCSLDEEAAREVQFVRTALADGGRGRFGDFGARDNINGGGDALQAVAAGGVGFGVRLQQQVRHTQHAVVSDQGDTFPHTLHGVYYLNDTVARSSISAARDTRSIYLTPYKTHGGHDSNQV